MDKDTQFLVDRHDEPLSAIRYIRGLEEHPNRGTDQAIRGALELIRSTGTAEPQDDTSSEESAEPDSVSSADEDDELQRIEAVMQRHGAIPSPDEDEGGMGLFNDFTLPQLQPKARQAPQLSPRPGPSRQHDDDKEERRCREAMAAIEAGRPILVRRPTTSVNLLDEESRQVQKSPIGVLMEAPQPAQPEPTPPSPPEPQDQESLEEDRRTRSCKIYNGASLSIP